MGERTAASIAETLGTPLQRYVRETRENNISMFLLGAGILFGLVCFYQAYVSTVAPTHPGRANIAWATVGITSIFLGFGARFLDWQKRGLYIELYTDGLVYVQAGKSQAVRWEDISAVRQSITHHTKYGQVVYITYIYRLQTTDKRTFELSNDIVGIAELGRIIQHEMTDRLYPQMVAAYNAGQTVSFDPFTISKEGVGHKNKYLSWAEIEDVEINNGYILFKKQGKWLNWVKVAAGEIANLPTFLALVNHVVDLRSKN